MKVKFSRCQSNSLTDVPIIDGQLIFVKDNGECYLDVGSQRVRIEDKILIEKVTSLETLIDTYKESIDEQLNTHTEEIAQIKHDIANIEAMHLFSEYEGLVTNGTTVEFFESVKALNLNPGTIILGGTKLTDIQDVAPGMLNEEMKVEIYPNNVFHATMTSTDVEPYEWIIQYWKGNEKWRPLIASASEIVIDTSGTSLEATTVQEAVVELDTKVGDISALLDKINGSGTGSEGGNA